jgi:hypothetical protein
VIAVHELVAAWAAGAFCGGSAVFWIAARHWARWADEHNYRRVRLEATRVQELHADRDHEHRLRVRREREAARLRAVADDLLDRLAQYRRPAHQRRSAYAGLRYGANR